MNFYQLLEQLKAGTLDSIREFRPELTLCATIVLMLLVRLPSWGHKINAFYIALPGSMLALYFSAPWNFLTGEMTLKPQAIFDGLLIVDPLTVYFRSLLFVFAVLFLVFTKLSGIPDREDSPDFYSLVLGATLGMCLMAEANHLFIVFLGVEMASVPSYVLAGMLKGRRQSSEAALKYSIYGAGTAGVMLYGISLLAGALGTMHLPTMATMLAEMPADLFAERQGVLMLGGLMLMVGLAFKLSAVPFHFWCPDVFEGASAEVNAFLSVASKAAALALLLRVAVGFGQTTEVVTSNKLAQSPIIQSVAYRQPDDAPPVPPKADPAIPAPAAADLVPADAPAPLSSDLVTHDASAPNLGKARHYIVGLIALLSVVTCTFGNLAAYTQTNIKRLLAYSTIAHAGYMMMPVAAAVQLMGRDTSLAEKAVSGLCLYVGIYVFMNLGAFAIVAFLRNAMRSEEIKDYAGLVKTQPGVVICFSVILLSLLGLPPLAGFAAKFAIFSVLVTDPLLMTLLVIGGMNTVISLVYYLRVVKVMTLDPEPTDRLPITFSLTSPEGVYMVLITLPVFALGVWFDPLSRWGIAAAKNLFS